jgi:hypothetical protein
MLILINELYRALCSREMYLKPSADDEPAELQFVQLADIYILEVKRIIFKIDLQLFPKLMIYADIGKLCANEYLLNYVLLGDAFYDSAL